MWSTYRNAVIMHYINDIIIFIINVYTTKLLLGKRYVCMLQNYRFAIIFFKKACLHARVKWSLIVTMLLPGIHVIQGIKKNRKTSWASTRFVYLPCIIPILQFFFGGDTFAQITWGVGLSFQQQKIGTIRVEKVHPCTPWSFFNPPPNILYKAL